MEQITLDTLTKDGALGWRQSYSTIPHSHRQSFIANSTSLIFVDTAALGTADHQALENLLNEDFSVPDWFWDPLYAESNGFFCAREVRCADGSSTYCTAIRFLSKHASSSKSRRDSHGSDVQYKWDKLSFCTQWRPMEKSLALLCFDIPTRLKEQMTQKLLGGTEASFSTTPLAFLAFLLPFIVATFDQAVWSCRNLIRELEQDRPDVLNPRLQYIRMHEIARHAIHSTEMLGTSLTVLDSISVEMQQRANSGEDTTAVQRGLSFNRTTMRCLQLRSQALEDRLRNEINLAFHIGSQHQSIISARISEATQRDGLTMKTISVLGVVFLPGTLISSIFSMTFFNFSPGSTSGSGQAMVSNKFWIYWAFTAPITIIVIALWLLYQLAASRRANGANGVIVEQPVDKLSLD